MRKPYHGESTTLLECNLSKKEPLHLFDEWFQIVKNDPRTVEANAMCLATATKSVVLIHFIKKFFILIFLGMESLLHEWFC